jgi:hypothetical protein
VVTPGKKILHLVAVTISATLLDTLLTPVLFLRFGKKTLERILAAARESARGAGERTAARPADAI